MADSASESDSSSIDGASLQPAGSSMMMPPSPVTREQQNKRIESLQQQNRVFKVELETYKLRVKALQEENRALRQASVNIQAKAEMEEEYISNTLLKKIQALKKEKETLAHHYEQEEECLTNDLSRKLNQLRQEKCKLEQTLENEQECLVNKLMRKIEKLEAETLQKQNNLDQLRREKVELENTLEQEQESLVNRLWKRMDKLEAEKRSLQNKVETTTGFSYGQGPSSTLSLNSLSSGGHRLGNNQPTRASLSLEGERIPGSLGIRKHSREREDLQLPSIHQTLNSLQNSVNSAGGGVPSSGASNDGSAAGDMNAETESNDGEKPNNNKLISSVSSDSFSSASGGDTANMNISIENQNSYVTHLRGEVERLKGQLMVAQQQHTEKMTHYTMEERQIRDENIRLQRRLQLEMERRLQLCRHLSESESSLEMEDERNFHESLSSMLPSGGGPGSGSVPILRPRPGSSPGPFMTSPGGGGGSGNSRPMSPGGNVNIGHRDSLMSPPSPVNQRCHYCNGIGWTNPEGSTCGRGSLVTTALQPGSGSSHSSSFLYTTPASNSPPANRGSFPIHGNQQRQSDGAFARPANPLSSSSDSQQVRSQTPGADSNSNMSSPAPASPLEMPMAMSPNMARNMIPSPSPMDTTNKN